MGKSTSMKLRTVFMPEPYTQRLIELVRQGYYPSISEAIRLAVRDLLIFHDKIRVKQ